MMKIDLKEIPAYYINLPFHEEKRTKIETTLTELDIKHINRLDGVVFPENPVAGCARAHHNALDTCSDKLPFLLFEDDILVVKERWNNGIFEIPDDVDALYLGTSTWGRMNGHNGQFVQYDKLDSYPGILRVYNLLAAHAVLYFSEDYLKMCKRISYHSGFILNDYADVGFSEIHRYFKIYAFDDPLFTQTSNLEGTNKSISSIEHTICMSCTPQQFYPYKLK